MNTRALAARTLAPVLTQKSALDSGFADATAVANAKDYGFYKELCYGVCRHYFSLDAVLAQLLTKPLKNKDADVRALLLLGLYQLWYMRVPDHAAINESVNATKSLKKPWAKNVVNGILRRFLREKASLIDTIGNAASEHPPWLSARLLKAWPDKADAIMAANNQQAPMTLRVNLRQGSRDAYSAQLNDAGIAHSLCDYSPVGISLSNAVDVQQLPGFFNGTCSVQDEAAQISTTLLDLAPGQRVLDACCAPGGKTCHIAESEAELTALVGVDLEASRLERVRENLQRLNLHADLHTADVSDLAQWWDNTPFDRILLDAPCSATGVIRRHPDIKLLRRESDIEALAKLQLRILQQLWQTLSPGGLLVYATCSVLPQENENLIKTFVEQQADAIHLAIDAPWGEARPYGRQLFPNEALPQRNSHDGFYYARISKAPSKEATSE